MSLKIHLKNKKINKQSILAFIKIEAFSVGLLTLRVDVNRIVSLT